jgi:hypothetical protein
MLRWQVAALWRNLFQIARGLEEYAFSATVEGQ